LLPPPLPGLVGRGGVRQLVGVADQHFVSLKIELARQELIDGHEPLIQPLQQPIEHRIGKTHVARVDHVIQIVAALAKFIDVRLIEIQLPAVQPLEEQVESPLRNLVVQRVLRQMFLPHHHRDQPRHRAIVGTRATHLRDELGLNGHARFRTDRHQANPGSPNRDPHQADANEVANATGRSQRVP